MSIKNESVTPYNPYGPATGVPTPEPHNQVLGGDHYTGDVTPGTDNYVQVGNIPYGPATGVPTPEKQNKVLSTGKDHEYTGDVTPGTSNYVQVGHIPGGPGHKDCDHE